MTLVVIVNSGVSLAAVVPPHLFSIFAEPTRLEKLQTELDLCVGLPLEYTQFKSFSSALPNRRRQGWSGGVGTTYLIKAIAPMLGAIVLSPAVIGLLKVSVFCGVVVKASGFTPQDWFMIRKLHE